MTQPELVVFDLDLTLWECGEAIWCDCLTPPFRIQGERILDRRGSRISLYPDVAVVLDRLDDLGISMALASRTQEPEWARELLNLLEIAHRFEFAEIYPGSKFSHFSSLRADSTVEYRDMIFFDDEQRNIRDIQQLGVHCVHVRSGISLDVLNQALSAF